MKYEQLQFMKVIEFPKNKDTELKLLKDKQDSAMDMINYLTDRKKDFHIVVSKSTAEELFEMDKFRGDKVVITSNYEEAKRIFPELKNTIFYKLTGDEFK